MKKGLLLLMPLLAVNYCFADAIVTQDGIIQNGLILSATDSTVVIRSEIGIRKSIDKNTILSIQF